jgi:hypothetical protein
VSGAAGAIRRKYQLAAKSRMTAKLAKPCTAPTRLARVAEGLAIRGEQRCDDARADHPEADLRPVRLIESDRKQIEHHRHGEETERKHDEHLMNRMPQELGSTVHTSAFAFHRRLKCKIHAPHEAQRHPRDRILTIDEVQQRRLIWQSDAVGCGHAVGAELGRRRPQRPR